MPTYFGPTNIPPLEAFSLNVPVCYSDLDGLREQVGEAAFLMNLKNPESLARETFVNQANMKAKENLDAFRDGSIDKQAFSDKNAKLATFMSKVENGADIGVTTCGAITRSQDPSKSYECFAQDITENVSEGEEYEFSFWAKLSDDYKDSENKKF